jgi:hypothetical protein
VDEESKVLSIVTIGTWTAKKALKTSNNSSGIRRFTRVKYLVQIFTIDGLVVHHYAYMVRVIHEVEPTCFEQAVKWDNVVDEEIMMLNANATWELVALLKDKKKIGCKWVYKVKHNANEFVSKYKTRLVTEGYAQIFGINYEETYNLVAKMTTVRIIIAITTTKG